jgi:hypothetical protein
LTVKRRTSEFGSFAATGTRSAAADAWRARHRARDATKTDAPRMDDESLASIVDEARGNMVTRLGARAGALTMTVDADPSTSGGAPASARFRSSKTCCRIVAHVACGERVAARRAGAGISTFP